MKTLKLSGKMRVVSIKRESEYLRGVDAAHELAQHIDTVITYSKDAYDAASQNTENDDEVAIQRLNAAASRAYKAVAILRKRSPRNVA